MFGCLAVYVGDKTHDIVPDKVQDKVQDNIVLILRDKRDRTADNGVWPATIEDTTRVCAGSSPTCDPSRS
jgi:hypothetical protein